MESRDNFYKLKVIKKWMSIAQVYGMTHFSMNPEDISQIMKYLKEGPGSVTLKLIDKR